MALSNAALRDVGVSHAIGLRRLSTGVTQKVIGLLDQVDADLVAQLEKYDPTSVASRYTRMRLDKLLTDVRALNKDVYKQVGKTLAGDLVDLARYETEYQARSVGNVLGVASSQFNLPTQPQLVAAVTDEPFNGRLLKEWVDGLEAGRFDRLRSAVRMSVVEGESIRDLVNRIVGTPELNFKDGILQTSRRSAEAMARTATTHAATMARQMVYEENKDILDGWRFVATLETTTCAECASLDGQVFAIGEGPYPPRHTNCRCTTVPVVKGGGQADRVTYAQWLKDQPPEVQDEALGKAKAELFRSGNLTLDRFVDDLGRPLTLNQLAKLEPQAFLEADLFAHPGAGYTENAYVDASGIIHTDSVVDAVKALWNDVEVELDQPRKVSILIERLAQVARDMERAGEEAPNFNLCKITLAGTSIFCVESADLPRLAMPQLKGVPIPGSFASEFPPDVRGEVDLSHQFRDYMEKLGYAVTDEQELVSYLHATQNELNGAKVAQLMKIEQTTGLDYARLFVSKDNYIVDGHHRWAAQVGAAYAGDERMLIDVARIDADILTIVKEARSFSTEWGIPQTGVGFFPGEVQPVVTETVAQAFPVAAQDELGLAYRTAQPDWVKRSLKVELPPGYSVPKMGRVEWPNEEMYNDYTGGFSNLENFRVIAPDNRNYNCVAEAVNDRKRGWWWPDTGNDFWPKGAYKGETVESFDIVFTKLVKGEGISVESGMDAKLAYEEGYVKVALFGHDYGGDTGFPTHMVRQLENGTWVSKMGGSDTLALLDPREMEGGAYGDIIKLYKIPVEEFEKLAKLPGGRVPYVKKYAGAYLDFPVKGGRRAAAAVVAPKEVYLESLEPGRPDITTVVSKAHLKKLKAGVEAIPERHAKLLENVPISGRDYLIDDWGEVHGLYTVRPDGSYPRIQIADKYHRMIETKVTPEQIRAWETGELARFPTGWEEATLQLKDVEHVTVHELGHALDVRLGRAPDRLVAKQVFEDAGALTHDQALNAAHFLEDPKEAFAEAYSLVYSPKGDAFNLPLAKAKKVFAKSMQLIKNMEKKWATLGETTPMPTNVLELYAMPTPVSEAVGTAPIQPNWMDENGYVYHGTNQEYLDSIAKKGLVPLDDKTWFTSTPKAGESYAVGEDKVVLRVKAEDVPDLQYSGGSRYGGVNTATTREVPADKLEILVDNDWKPLVEVQPDLGSVIVSPNLAPIPDKEEHIALIKKGIAAIPSEHQAVLKDLDVIASKDLKVGSYDVYGLYNVEPVQGLFERTAGSPFPGMVNIAMESDGRAVEDVAGVTVHELGHALDAASGGRYSTYVQDAVTADAALMSEAERYIAAHYFSNPKEKFAELYRLAYSPSGEGAFGMSKSRAEVVFAKSLAKFWAITEATGGTFTPEAAITGGALATQMTSDQRLAFQIASLLRRASQQR